MVRARTLVIMAALSLAASAGHAEASFGGGVSWEMGNSPLSPVLAQVFAENVYRIGPWETFGLDLVVATAPVHNDTYASKGMSSGPMVFLGADASYRFPQLGPAEAAVLIGGCGFQDYENLVNGSAAHAGVELTVHFGAFLVRARGLYRFFTWTANAQPVPIGAYSVALLGGYSIPTAP